VLFDLRGRGRRRTVRVVYIGLALLIGVGLIGFGIGGGFGGGGLLTAASNNEGAGSASFAAQITKYRKITQQQPTNLAAWESLTKALLHEAGGEQYLQAGRVTSKGREVFSEAAQAWEHYLALNPAHPNTELAQLMVTVYGEGGLNEPARAVQVLQIVTTARPKSAALWAALAEYAYKARNFRIGDLASERAVKLAPTNQRQRLQRELAEVRKSPSGGRTYTTTTNGKTYTGTLNANKEVQATEVKTTPPPAGTTSTTKK
jgi:tetratricopeptide (TPR) repeat protein